MFERQFSLETLDGCDAQVRSLQLAERVCKMASY